MNYTLEDVPTPAIVIDPVTVDRNIKRMADYVKSHGIGLRPHTKTHKSLLMSQKQLDAGAVGLTVAKVGEAQVMAKTGAELLLAYPALDPARTKRIAELAKTVKIIVAVDSMLAVENIAAAARAGGSEAGILVDIDTGMGRTGVQTPQLALAIAQYVEQTAGVVLDGLFTYPGHINLPADEQGELLGVVQDVLSTTIELWKEHGLEARIVSGGSTPGALQSHMVPAYTEIRPGTYIYMDRNCFQGGWFQEQDVAMKIMATVVSDAVPDKCVLDCGNKTLAMDICMGKKELGHGKVVEYPAAKIVQLSEEHGEVDLSLCDERPQLGDRVQVIVNHVCPTINLQDMAWLKQEDGTLEALPIDARGLLS
jgi:D-serine deaminase-like pyridoxal phosphate-dependent protein